MGYNIFYEGTINFDRPLDDDTARIINGLSITRRMTWDTNAMERDGIALKKNIGERGELFFTNDLNKEDKEKLERKYVLDYNEPPGWQPALWGVWAVTDDRMSLIWNRNGKSYAGEAWLTWILCEVLVPRGYYAAGTINWFSQRDGKFHTIVNNRTIKTVRGYSKKQKEPDVEAWYEEQYSWYEEYHQKWLTTLAQEKIEYLRKMYDNGKEVHAFNLLINDKVVQVSYYDHTFVSSRYLYLNLRKENGVFIHDEFEDERDSIKPDKSTLDEAKTMVEGYIKKAMANERNTCNA